MKKYFFSVIFFGLVIFSGFAKGNVDEREPKDPESWTESIDITDNKRGKYNVLITATDIAGNEGFFGPFNMFIDPASDLPVTTISNPHGNARITGNINIVGTCVDDDSVAYVEFKIDDQEQVYRAKGTVFWSYYFDTSSLEEGEHTIEAWGVDINGVKGKSHITTFNLDRRAPETELDSESFGDFVSGYMIMSGLVEDGNGIDTLHYSVDGGKKFKPAKIRYNKKKGKWSFEIKIDTTQLEDGPQVCWIKATDTQGTVGVYTKLFFVDNTPPTVEFIYPSDDAISSGVFSVAGRAFDIVGLKRLSYKCGYEQGDFELIAGNSYWVKEIDLTDSSARHVTFEITAEDLAGNIITERKNINIDRNLDIPTIVLSSPLENESVEGGAFISGVAHDLYGIQEIRYSIDNGVEESVETEFGGFGIPLNDLEAGAHTLKIYPINIKGVEGIATRVNFNIKGALPTITFDNGQIINNLSGGRAYIDVSSTAGLKAVYYNDGESLEADAGIKFGTKQKSISVDTSRLEAAHIKKIRVRAIDIYDREMIQTLLVVDSTVPSTGSEFEWSDQSPIISITDINSLYGVYASPDDALIESISLGNAKGAVSANVTGNVVELTALKDGIYNNVSITITDTSGVKITTMPVSMVVDTSAPVINLELPETPAFVNNTLSFKGSVTDGSSVKSVSYTINDLPPAKIASRFSENVNISKLEDGPVVLKISAVDNTGRVSNAYRIFYKDTKIPSAEIVLPTKGDVVNGKIVIAFKADDVFPLAKVEYKLSANSSTWIPMDISSLPNTIIGDADSPISNKMLFKFVDKAGNEKIFRDFEFNIDNTLDEPVVDLHVPDENAVITKDFVLSGIVYDDDAPAKLYYKIDNGEYKAIKVENSFSIDFSLSDFTDNEHTISLYAEDIYGVKGKVVKRKIRVSLDTPKAEFIKPNIDETLKGEFVISGKASDKNGIEKVEISVDNGNTYNLATGTENWSYRINTHVIDDGTHVAFVKAYDKYGQVAVFSSLINIDNTAPFVQFTYPLIESKLDENLFISGHVDDNISLEKVTAKIKSLDGKSVPSSLRELKIGSDFLVSKDVNISSLPEGSYNLEIVAIDKAENITTLSRNFEVVRNKEQSRVELLYPLSGEYIKGEFNVYGRIVSDKKVDEAHLYINGQRIDTVPVSKTNYISFRLTPEQVAKGKQSIAIRANLPGKGMMESVVHTINYDTYGPWISIDNFAMGDFAIDRPYLEGRAGYSVSDEEMEYIKSKEASEEEVRLAKMKRLDKVEISFDNGKTFHSTKVKRNGSWRYRIETRDMANGNHFLLVRAVMDNKEVAISRTIVKIDKILPSITLISPGEGGRYNEHIDFSGLATDNIGLEKINILLRKGDKATYGVPKFIQGLHFEAGIWGASLWNVGFGLSFFDNNVKVQFHYGQFTQKQWTFFARSNATMRYGGHIVSLKLLANIFDIPVGYYAGPDWDWLHFTGALGANFSVFTKTQSGKAQVLAGILTQLEMPRVMLSKKKKKYFRTFAFFLEGTLWFVPTDVDSAGSATIIKSVIPHLAGGVRLDVF